MRAVALAALFTGMVAAALDFSAGYMLSRGADGAGSGDPAVFTGFLLALGVVALSSGVAAVLPLKGDRTRQVGLLMEVCGVAMAAVSALAPIMAPLTDFAMLAVGGLMVLSGALMQRKNPVVPGV